MDIEHEYGFTRESYVVAYDSDQCVHDTPV